MRSFENISNQDFINIFNISDSKSDILKRLNLSNNGTHMRYINKMVDKLGLSFDILKQNHYNKYHLKKICPVCNKEFIVPNYEQSKVCCSYACSNTYFRSGENNGMFKGRKDLFDSLSEIDKQKYIEYSNKHKKRQEKISNEHRKRNIKNKEYIKICFENHPHKCCVCGEENIVAVHHYDGNHFNNEPSNLVPLCPTHHCYIHTKKLKHLIQDKIDEYRNNFLFRAMADID